MKNYQHQELSEGRWFTFSLDEQMGNIGAEVGRAMNWKAKGELEQMWKALDRGLELLDLTLSDKRLNSSKLREIFRVREVVCDFIVGDNNYKSDQKFLNSYFTQFAIAARLNK